ncbi:hypothetical protein Gotur_026049 [Gossypium turneri]
MEKKGIILCFVVVLLGIISTGAGFAAEVTRVKASQVKVDVLGQCSYPKSPALGLSLISAGTLLIGKIIIIIAAGCFCCRRTDPSHSSNHTKALTFYIISWITFIIAIGLLLKDIALNNQVDEVTTSDGRHYCYVIKPGVFTAGPVYAALSSSFGVLYYLTLNSKQDDATNAPNLNQVCIVMAQSQFAFEDPSFVHGYANNKQQFS